MLLDDAAAEAPDRQPSPSEPAAIRTRRTARRRLASPQPAAANLAALGPATSTLPMSALICGSLAYDTIMVFPDQFKNHILPDKVHILNVSFLVPRMRREFGGCAGNIAYNLKLLGGDPIPMATVGQDFGPYREYFEELGIRLDQVKEIPELFTAAGLHHHRPRQQPDHRLPSRAR